MSDPINLNIDPQTTGQSIGSLMQLTAQAAPAVQGYFQNKIIIQKNLIYNQRIVFDSIE